MSDSLLLELQGGKPAEPTLSSFDKFVSMTYKIFSGPATRITESMPSLRTQILRSNLRTSPEGLVSLALFSSLVTGVVAAVSSLVWGIWFRSDLRTPFPLVFMLFVAVPIVYLLVTSMPSISSSGRATGIDTEMPFVLGYMSVLAGGGVSPLETLRRVSKMDVLPASSKEAKRILLDTDVFGYDPITAMENAARQSPSRYWSEFLAGYCAVLKTGGDYESYIQTKLRDIISNRSARTRSSSDLTGTVAEAYLTITVVLGMTLYTLYMVEAMLSGNLSALNTLYLFAFLVVPLVSVGFIWMVDSIQTKWPYVDYRPYKLMGYMTPIALAIFVIPLPIPLYLHVSIALIVVSGPPAFVTNRISRERTQLEKTLPDFIADVTEGRKTGLSPEQSIERLSTRNYGVLSKHVKKMAAQLSWGLSLTKVITSFTSAVGSWVARATGVLLIEVVDVGGGTIRSFTDMAAFARTINDLETQRRSALRPFVVVTYIAAIMVVMTTFILLYFLAAPSALGVASSTSAASNAGTIDLLLTTAVFDAFVIGLVAGKFGESSVADGFKHSLILVCISLLAIVIASRFIAGVPF